MNYFTADWHLGDDRIGINIWVDAPTTEDPQNKSMVTTPNLLFRPFNSVEIQDTAIISNLKNSEFNDGDTLYHLGDVVVNVTPLNTKLLTDIRSNFPNSKFILIEGNYDTEDKKETLSLLFDEFHQDLHLMNYLKNPLYLNHYPIKTLNELTGTEDIFGITGHIHGLWKVQPRMINVGVDAWHFKPVSEEQIAFCINAMQNHYDENIFPIK